MRWPFALHRPHIRLQTLPAHATARRCAGSTGLGREQLSPAPRAMASTLPFHAGGADLHRQRVAETVDHQPGQVVAFGMNQPVERLGHKGASRNVSARVSRSAKNSGVDHRIAFRRQQPDRDQAFGIEIAGAESAAVLAPHIDHRAGRSALAAASMRISLEKIQGEPPRARRPFGTMTDIVVFTGHGSAGAATAPPRHASAHGEAMSHMREAPLTPCAAVHAVLRCAPIREIQHGRRRQMGNRHQFADGCAEGHFWTWPPAAAR